jgi:tRNA(Ile)-lysidine synthase
VTDAPLSQRFADAMGQLLGPDFPTDLGLAISGGGDSMAMLYLTHNWTREYGVRLWGVTVDHGLRAESAAEAAMVAEECATLGWPHATLRWHWDGSGNVQDAARRARLALIDRWRGNVRHVLFAHTRDDQAETVLMRLARGSGVDGLAGMRAAREIAPHARNVLELTSQDMSGDAPPRNEVQPGYQVLRPCLDLGRAELRHYLTVLKGRWVDDPSNENTDFERVRIRKFLALLQQEGFATGVLSDTARRMARARDGLTARLVEAVRLLCLDAPLGQVIVDRDGFAALDDETRLRLLTAALRYVSGSEYRPRAASSEALLQQILSGGGGTLHGAEVLVEKTNLRILREVAAVSGDVAPLEGLWDNQWHLEGSVEPLPETAVVRALGEDGWCQIEDRAGLTVPFRGALSAPSVWLGSTLLACPVLGIGPEMCVSRHVLGRPDTGFEAFCLSH